jgi:hypothetical protein
LIIIPKLHFLGLYFLFTSLNWYKSMLISKSKWQFHLVLTIPFKFPHNVWYQLEITHKFLVLFMRILQPQKLKIKSNGKHRQWIYLWIQIWFDFNKAINMRAGWYVPVIPPFSRLDTGGSQVWGQPGLQSKTLSKKEKGNLLV